MPPGHGRRTRRTCKPTTDKGVAQNEVDKASDGRTTVCLDPIHLPHASKSVQSSSRRPEDKEDGTKRGREQSCSLAQWHRASPSTEPPREARRRRRRSRGGTHESALPAEELEKVEDELPRPVLPLLDELVPLALEVLHQLLALVLQLVHLVLQQELLLLQGQ